MGAESGEALAAIIRRKEYERQIGGGLFAWGIGNALGTGIDLLAAAVVDPLVVFSPMPSRPKREDAAPGSVLLWTAYDDVGGASLPLPPHIIITSRGHVGENVKARHYALFCSSSSPLTERQASFATVQPATLVNFSSLRRVGASQVTAVVRQMRAGEASATEYNVAFTAKLAGPRYARLHAPRRLQADEVIAMTKAASGTLDNWLACATALRAHDGLRESP